jgi:hypothetical protein
MIWVYTMGWVSEDYEPKFSNPCQVSLIELHGIPNKSVSIYTYLFFVGQQVGEVSRSILVLG